MAVIDIIKEKAKADKKTIVLPESEDRRTYEAAAQILKEDLANLVIIGTPEDIGAHSEGLDVSGATIINPQTYEKTQEYIDLFVELRKSKGMTPEKAKETILSDYAYYGCLMIKNGDADGMVSGACHSTANTLRPCLQVIKTKPGTKLVSAFFLMEVPDCDLGSNGTFVFARHRELLDRSEFSPVQGDPEEFRLHRPRTYCRHIDIFLLQLHGQRPAVA